MPARERAVVFWSGGKDSALALDAVRAECDVLALLTTLNEDEGCSGMHRIRRELIEQQAAALGLPVQFISLPAFPPNALYRDRVRAALRPFLPQGVRRAVFGDLFLEDIRAWRGELLRPLGMEAVYPLWGRDTKQLAHDFIERGFRAVLACVDTRRLHADFAGREFDDSLLKDLPTGVDPCGENGEFHTFVFDGPPFSEPVKFRAGQRETVDVFCFSDLVPAASPWGKLRLKNCARCGATFTCGPQPGEGACWCDTLPHLPLAGREPHDCLCPKCLLSRVAASGLPAR